MDSTNRNEAGRQTAGGLAALYLALAYLAAMPYFLIVVDYLGATTIGEKVALIIGNYPSMYAMYLATYSIFGIALGVLVFTLYDRAKSNAPALARMTAAIGVMWSFALVASGMIYMYGMSTVVGLAKTDLSQAQATWQAMEPVAMGLGGAGGEILGGLWILLTSLTALRCGALPKVLNWLGIAIGVTGLVSVIPPLRDASMAFGVLQIPWLIWLGITLLRQKQTGNNPGM
jgi:hypothetical protein